MAEPLPGDRPRSRRDSRDGRDDPGRTRECSRSTANGPGSFPLAPMPSRAYPEAIGPCAGRREEECLRRTPTTGPRPEESTSSRPARPDRARQRSRASWHAIRIDGTNLFLGAWRTDGTSNVPRTVGGPHGDLESPPAHAGRISPPCAGRSEARGEDQGAIASSAPGRRRATSRPRSASRSWATSAIPTATPHPRRAPRPLPGPGRRARRAWPSPSAITWASPARSSTPPGRWSTTRRGCRKTTC